MAQQTKKVDNKFLADKVALRAQSLPQKQTIKVLDVFAGKGTLWNLVREKTKKNIQVVSIDKRDDLYDFHLHGDNLRILRTLDLTNFDVIDLDAYGFPDEQLNLIFTKGYKGIVHLTMIQANLCQLPYSILEEAGINKDLLDAARGIFAKQKLVWPIFSNWLYKKGVKTVYLKEKVNKGAKRYMWFETK